MYIQYDCINASACTADAVINSKRSHSSRFTDCNDFSDPRLILSHPDTYWMTGNVVGVDGGEDIAG